MLPKKKLIDRARENGSIDRLNTLLSGAHILICVANSYLEEANDVMRDNGLLIGEIKKRYSNYVWNADRYFDEFAKMIVGAKMDMFSDMESLDRVFRQWSKIDKDWEPKESE